MESLSGSGGRQRLDALLRGLADKDEQDAILCHLPGPAHEILTANIPVDICVMENFYGSVAWNAIKLEAFQYFTEVASLAPSCDLLGHAHLDCPVDCIQLGEVNKALGTYTLRLVKCLIPSHPRKKCILPVVIYRSLDNSRYMGRVICKNLSYVPCTSITTTWPRPLPTRILPGVPMSRDVNPVPPPASTSTLTDHYVYADDALPIPANGQDDLITLNQFYLNNLVKMLE